MIQTFQPLNSEEHKSKSLPQENSIFNERVSYVIKLRPNWFWTQGHVKLARPLYQCSHFLEDELPLAYKIAEHVQGEILKVEKQITINFTSIKNYGN